MEGLWISGRKDMVDGETVEEEGRKPAVGMQYMSK